MSSFFYSSKLIYNNFYFYIQSPLSSTSSTTSRDGVAPPTPPPDDVTDNADNTPLSLHRHEDACKYIFITLPLKLNKVRDFIYIDYYLPFISFTLCPAHSWVGRGNLY